TAAARHDGGVMHAGVREGGSLAGAERRLSLLREDVGDARTRRPFDLRVEVDERDAQATGQLLAHHGFPGAGHPHQIDDHASVSTYASRFRRVSSNESPPNFPRTAFASSTATTASPTPPPAGTAHTSVR